MAQVHNNIGNNFIVNTIEIQKDEKSKSTYTLEDAIKEASKYSSICEYKVMVLHDAADSLQFSDL